MFLDLPSLFFEDLIFVYVLDIIDNELLGAEEYDFCRRKMTAGSAGFLCFYKRALNYVFVIGSKVDSFDSISHYSEFFGFVIPWRKRLVKSGELCLFRMGGRTK
jgi:hypothetical protein